MRSPLKAVSIIERAEIHRLGRGETPCPTSHSFYEAAPEQPSYQAGPRLASLHGRSTVLLRSPATAHQLMKTFCLENASRLLFLWSLILFENTAKPCSRISKVLGAMRGVRM